MASSPHSQQDTSLELYLEVARETSATVLDRYSTSFSAAAALLGRDVMTDIRSVYGLVRIADEIVDTYRGPDAATVLDDLEAETYAAIARGFSSNLTVHAFAEVATRCGIGKAQIDPFFASMRMDLTVTLHDEESFRRYIFGSAEVVGEMCLAAFLNRDAPAPLPDVAAEGARRLGAAYQKVNFLRDLGFDADELGRAYVPTETPGVLTSAELSFWLDDTAADLTAARASLPLLPWRARLAVRATYELYRSLHTRIARVSPADLHRRRIRVPNSTKGLLVLKAIAATAVGR